MPFKKGHITWNKGKKTQLETIEKLRLSHLGKPGPKTKFKKGFMSGEKASNWRGGVTPKNKVIRRSLEFQLWREAVFKRDDWTCRWCGQRGGILHPHHIKPFAYYPELRFAIDNGITLCKACHMTTDNYGGSARRKKCE